MKKSIKNLQKSPQSEITEKDVSKVLMYATKCGFTITQVDRNNAFVSFSLNEKDYVYNTPDKLYLAANATSRVMLYDLLHELGHYEIRKKAKKYKLKYPISVNSEFYAQCLKITKYARRLEYKMDRFIEERNAWVSGLKLAKKLRIDINEEDYRRYSQRNLSTYFGY